MRETGLKLLLLIILFAIGYLPFANHAHAAVPTLQNFLSIIPKPVTDFFNSLQKFDFGSHDAQSIQNTLPGAGKPIANFFATIWRIIYAFLRGIGSVFVWIFHGFANFLDALIFSR